MEYLSHNKIFTQVESKLVPYVTVNPEKRLTDELRETAQSKICHLRKRLV